MLQEAQAFQWYDTHGCHLQYNSAMPIHHAISCPDSATLSHLGCFVLKREIFADRPKTSIQMELVIQLVEYCSVST